MAGGKEIALKLDDLIMPGTKTYVFIPADGKDMLTEYPELRTIDAFSSLSNAELVFVWLLANRTSPLAPDNEKNRLKATTKALTWSKLDKLVDAQTLALYSRQQFPQKLISALAKMSNFNPSIRMKAKMISEKMLTNIEKMVDVAEEEFEQMTLDDKNKYASFVKNVTNTLDELIVSNEDAYGVKVIKKREDKVQNKGETLMDMIMKH